MYGLGPRKMSVITSYLYQGCVHKARFDSELLFQKITVCPPPPLPAPRGVSMKGPLLTLWTNNVSFFGRFGKSNPRRQMPCYYTAKDLFNKWRSMYYSFRLFISLNDLICYYIWHMLTTLVRANIHKH